MTRTVLGVMRGKTIELDEDIGAIPGQKVEVQVKIIDSKKVYRAHPPVGDPVVRRQLPCALADLNTADEDLLLEEIHQDRKRERRPDVGT